jgi:hypothetical protein
MTNNDLMKIILTRNQARDLSAPIGAAMEMIWKHWLEG